jgi:diacylglycerol O-acyltransferase
MTDEIRSLDMAFLYLEQDAAPMHLGAVAVFGPGAPENAARLANIVADRAYRSPALLRRLHTPTLAHKPPRWVADPHIRAEDHVRVHHLPSTAGCGGLAALVSRVWERRLDLTRSPWELHIVSGLAEGRFAVALKLHHALADGIAATQIGLRLLDGDHAPEERRPVASGRVRSAVDPPRRLPDTFRQRPGDPIAQIRATVDNLLRTVGADGAAGEVVSAALRRVRLPMPDSPLAARLSVGRRIELVRLSLDDLRDIRRRHGGTMNDVLLALVAGALRGWLAARGHPTEGLDLRAAVPVRSRSRSPGRAGNQFTGYLCELPVGEPDPIRRLQAISVAMGHNRASSLSDRPNAFTALADRLSPAFYRLILPLARQGVVSLHRMLFDIVITNVPLPRVPLSLHGRELEELYPLAPLFPGQALGVAASQYQNSMYIGLQANRAAVPDLGRLVDALREAVAELHTLPGPVAS